MEEYRGYFIGEGIVVLLVGIFTFKLYKYNQILHEIQERFPNMIQQTIEIAQETNYINYLSGGFFFVFILIGYTVLVFKARLGMSGLVILCINFVLLVVLLIIFWNPVLATFACLLLGGGIAIIASN